MYSDIIIIGGGAAGLMAAYGAVKALPLGSSARITVLEKMPRPGRKILFTGKGRCNFTNLKDWNEFSQHIRTNPNFVKPAFYNFTPENTIDFLERNGLETVVERETGPSHIHIGPRMCLTPSLRWCCGME